MTETCRLNRYRWISLVLLIVCSYFYLHFPSAAEASSRKILLGPYMEGWVDSSGTTTFDDIRHSRADFNFKPLRNIEIPKGAPEIVTWFRFRAADAMPSGTDCRSGLFLFIGYFLPQNVSLFVPVEDLENRTYHIYQTGWDASLLSGDTDLINNSLLLPRQFDPDRFVYIRISDAFGGIPQLLLLSPAAYDRFISEKLSLEWLIAGVLLAMLLYNLAVFVFLWDRPYLHYVLYIGFLLIYLLTLWGQIQLLHPGLFRFLMQHIILVSALSMISALWFARSFLSSRIHTPRIDLAIQALAAVLAASAFLDLIHHSSLANLVVLVTAIILPAPLICAGWMRLRQGFAPARYFLMAWGVLGIGVLVFILFSFGILPMTLISFHSVGIASAVESILLSFALADRIRLLNLHRQQLLESERRLTELSITDELTGLKNKRYFLSKLASEVEHARRMHQPLAVILLDVDHFKEFNDTFGHLEGDVVLAGIGALIRKMIRDSDTGSRFGGEEFVIILPGVEENIAFEIAERIRKEAHTRLSSDLSRPVTISAGIATLQPKEDPESFLNRADHAMYFAKKSGRNQTVRYR
jgi:diguanylate cyclase (GGDEF)-like protein